jgi:hypothetical protein
MTDKALKLIERLVNEADLCRNDGANDIAALLDEAAKALAAPVQEPVAFEKWWEDHGQFCRAGGGEYEKTFAFRAWEAALATPPTAAPMTEFDEAVAAVDSTLHHAIDHWQDRALKAEALLAKSKQEPVAWLGFNPRTGAPEFACEKPAPSVMRDYNMKPLVYTNTTQPAAAQRQWVGLTKYEAAECWYGKNCLEQRPPFDGYAEAIEAKLKEKNT